MSCSGPSVDVFLRNTFLGDLHLKRYAALLQCSLLSPDPSQHVSPRVSLAILQDTCISPPGSCLAALRPQWPGSATEAPRSTIRSQTGCLASCRV
jgi:hypothetical protein